MRGTLVGVLCQKPQNSLAFLLWGSMSGIFVWGCEGKHKTEAIDESRPNVSEVKKDEASSETTPDGSLGSLDSENDQAIRPTQVAGAFLVAQCEQLDSNRASLPASVKDDDGLFGCNLKGDNKEVIEGQVSGSQFEVLPVGSKEALRGRPLKLPSRQWQNVFVVDGLGDQKVNYFFLKGDLSGVPFSFYQPLGAGEPDSSCLETDVKTGMLSSVMDFRSSKESLALGQEPVRIFEGVSWESGDVLHLENTSGQSVTRTLEQKLGLNPKYNYECPVGWVLTLTNDKGSVVGEFDLNKYRSIPIKNPNVSLWIGFKDRLTAAYAQNEGGSLAIAVGHSTDGCKFKFVRPLRSCLSR